MSTLWSKVLESIIAELTISETSDHWKANQFGGIKGSSTEHVLIESWNKILKSLDDPENKAVMFTALDFF